MLVKDIVWQKGTVNHFIFLFDCRLEELLFFLIHELCGNLNLINIDALHLIPDHVIDTLGLYSILSNFYTFFHLLSSDLLLLLLLFLQSFQALLGLFILPYCVYDEIDVHKCKYYNDTDESDIDG